MSDDWRTHATPLYGSAALREAERAAATMFGGDASRLMAHAGQAAWREVLRHWPDARRIVVLCGPGNNGGDGYVLARHAHETGRNVRVMRLLEHAPRGPLATWAHDRYVEAGGAVEVFDGAIENADLLVDAVFGIGLSRAPEGDAARLIDAVNTSALPVLALDVPSGVDADRGSAAGRAIRATRTLQFIAPHAGLYTGAALDYVGELSLADLDVTHQILKPLRTAAHRLDAAMLSFAFAPRARNAHKGSSGHALCIGGDEGKGGAVLLAAEAALRSGAGLVSVATRPQHVASMLARRPEAMAHGIENPAQLDSLLGAANAVAIGPGLGQQAWGWHLFRAALVSQRALVLDADALNLLARGERSLPADAVLTPHPGEAARLLGVSTQEVQANRFAAIRLLCEMHGCVVVLKGAGTLIAAPDEEIRLVNAGNPGMAVGGMGDVLTGVIVALRAQGFATFDAACMGALLHAIAGDDAARQGGERGLLPSDLFAHLRSRANGTMHA